MAFTRCLAMEAAEHFVTVNAIAPSFIQNEFIPRIYPEEEIRRMEEEIPFPRKGTPHDVARYSPLSRHRRRIHYGPNHLRYRWKLDAIEEKGREFFPRLPVPRHPVLLHERIEARARESRDAARLLDVAPCDAHEVFEILSLRFLQGGFPEALQRGQG